jgi:hypothetical protein
MVELTKSVNKFTPKKFYEIDSSLIWPNVRDEEKCFITLALDGSTDEYPAVYLRDNCQCPGKLSCGQTTF